MHRVPPELMRFATANNWCTVGIPEFQDAQRFVQGNASYGPIVQAIASPALADLKNTDRFDAGLVVVGTVYVWDEPLPRLEPYHHLNLDQGLHCIFLTHAGGEWSARIVKLTGTTCDPGASSVTSAPRIAVFAEDSTEAPGAIPPVARFVQADTRTFIGIRCGARWCDIGASKASEIPQPIFAGSVIPDELKNSAQIRVKGWWDEQQIAVDAANQNPPVKPLAYAAVVPVPALQGMPTSKFTGPRPVHAAYVYLSQDIPKYKERFGLTKGWNLVEIQGTTGSSDWKAVLSQSASSSHTNRVGWTQHTIGSIPGTARWAWMDRDEWVWVSCDDGCCLIRGGSE